MIVRQFLNRKFVQDTLALQAGKIITTLLSGISALLIWRLMGPESVGVFALAQSLFALAQSFDLTGVGISTTTRLAIAVGAKDDDEILNLMAVYIKVSGVFTVGLAVLLMVIGQPLAAALHGSPQIGILAFGLAIANIADSVYGLVMIALQSRRSMKTLALFQTVNQLVLSILLIGAVLLSATPLSLVVGRLVYSYLTMGLALWAYSRLRHESDTLYPGIPAVLRRMRTVSVRPYWRFGAVNAVDKNLSNLFTQLPIQIVGAVSGAGAVGYLDLALSGIAYGSVLTSAIFDNMAAVVPQAVGRGDYDGLRRNFIRVLLVLMAGGGLVFGALALTAPLVVPPLLGDEWTPAIPALMVLALYGAFTTVGGIFGPLYRALNLMRIAVGAKLAALVLVLPLGYVGLAGMGAVGGAWMINGMFAVSIGVTAILTLRALYRKTVLTP